MVDFLSETVIWARNKCLLPAITGVGIEKVKLREMEGLSSGTKKTVPNNHSVMRCYLPDCISPGNTIALYADDCKTSQIVDSPQDHVLFQLDLDNLCSWSRLNSMDFNIRTCKLMRISKKKTALGSKPSVCMTHP